MNDPRGRNHSLWNFIRFVVCFGSHFRVWGWSISPSISLCGHFRESNYDGESDHPQPRKWPQSEWSFKANFPQGYGCEVGARSYRVKSVELTSGVGPTLWTSPTAVTQLGPTLKDSPDVKLSKQNMISFNPYCLCSNLLCTFSICTVCPFLSQELTLEIAMIQCSQHHIFIPNESVSIQTTGGLNDFWYKLIECSNMIKFLCSLLSAWSPRVVKTARVNLERFRSRLP